MKKKILKNLPVGAAYFQTPRDNSCGPLTLLYVADLLLKRNKDSLTAANWIDGVKVLRGDNIWSDTLVSKIDLIRSFKLMGFTANVITGDNYDDKLNFIINAINDENPIVVSCLIKPFKYKKPYSHYAVIVGFDDRGVFLHDPYRRRNRPDPYHISHKIFGSKDSIFIKTVWGRSQWGFEVEV